MFLGFDYLYKFVVLCLFFFFQKAENNRLKKPFSQNFILFLFLRKIESVGPVDNRLTWSCLIL